MISKTVPNQQSDSTTHLKDIFEQSLAALSEEGDAIKSSQNRRTRRDYLPIHMDAASHQKRALDDAAKALATLWKISEPGRQKLQAREIHSNR